MLHSLVNVIDFGFDAQHAVNAPRFHHQWQPDSLWLEPDFPADVRRRLESLGWQLNERRFMGAAQLIVFDAVACLFWGGADARRDSGAAGVNMAPVDVQRPNCATAGTPAVLP